MRKNKGHLKTTRERRASNNRCFSCNTSWCFIKLYLRITVHLGGLPIHLVGGLWYVQNSRPIPLLFKSNIFALLITMEKASIQHFHILVELFIFYTLPKDC